MLQNGIERRHLGRVVASCIGKVGSGLSIPMFFLPVKPTTTTIKI